MDGQISPKLITKAISSGKGRGSLGTNSLLQQALLELEPSNVLGNQKGPSQLSNTPIGQSSNRGEQSAVGHGRGHCDPSWRPG